MHENSLAAYQGLRDHLSAKCFEVLIAYQEIGKPATDLEIKDHLGYDYPNSVRPRITQLKGAGFIREVDQGKNPSGRPARKSEIAVHTAKELLQCAKVLLDNQRKEREARKAKKEGKQADLTDLTDLTDTTEKTTPPPKPAKKSKHLPEIKPETVYTPDMFELIPEYGF